MMGGVCKPVDVVVVVVMLEVLFLLFGVFFAFLCFLSFDLRFSMVLDWQPSPLNFFSNFSSDLLIIFWMKSFIFLESRVSSVAIIDATFSVVESSVFESNVASVILIASCLILSFLYC